MNRQNIIKLFYLIAGVLSFVNGAWMLLYPFSWYTSFPADVSHTGPFNQHFIRDLGVAFIVVALGFGWCARNIDRSRPVHFALTIFLAGHALIHLVDITTGHLPASHWLIDLPGVFLPALIMIVLSIPRVRNLLGAS